MLFLLCSFLLWYVTSCCCLFGMPAQGCSVHLPSVLGSSMLPSPMPPAEVWCWVNLNVWPPRVCSAQHTMPQCLLLRSYSIPSWDTNTCSLHERHQTQKHVVSLFLSSSFWGGSIGGTHGGESGHLALWFSVVGSSTVAAPFLKESGEDVRKRWGCA